MSNGPSHRIDGKQRVQILTLHSAARRVAARHFNDYDADIASMYWVGPRTVLVPLVLTSLSRAAALHV